MDNMVRKHKVPPPLVALGIYTFLVIGVIMALKHVTLLAVPLFFALVVLP